MLHPKNATLLRTLGSLPEYPQMPVALGDFRSPAGSLAPLIYQFSAGLISQPASCLQISPDVVMMFSKLSSQMWITIHDRDQPQTFSREDFKMNG